jgi:hypothetical protein
MREWTRPEVPHGMNPTAGSTGSTAMSSATRPMKVAVMNTESAAASTPLAVHKNTLVLRGPDTSVAQDGRSGYCYLGAQQVQYNPTMFQRVRVVVPPSTPPLTQTINSTGSGTGPTSGGTLLTIDGGGIVTGSGFAVGGATTAASSRPMPQAARASNSRAMVQRGYRVRASRPAPRCTCGCWYPHPAGERHQFRRCGTLARPGRGRGVDADRSPTPPASVGPTMNRVVRSCGAAGLHR